MALLGTFDRCIFIFLVLMWVMHVLSYRETLLAVEVSFCHLQNKEAGILFLDSRLSLLISRCFTFKVFYSVAFMKP